jgi:hypothetical protein
LGRPWVGVAGSRQQCSGQASAAGATSRSLRRSLLPADCGPVLWQARTAVRHLPHTGAWLRLALWHGALRLRKSESGGFWEGRPRGGSGHGSLSRCVQDTYNDVCGGALGVLKVPLRDRTDRDWTTSTVYGDAYIFRGYSERRSPGRPKSRTDPRPRE